MHGPAVDEAGRVAAVAAVLRESRGGAELLFIRRAKRAGDPWSGHMAWPGGKREACDAGTLECAIRETREEVGLDLAQSGELIGSLKGWRQERSGPKGLRAVIPYVFAIATTAELRPGPEVQETIWIPISYFTSWTSRGPWSLLAPFLPLVPPAYRYEGRLIWGLTLWMLADLLGRLGNARP
jgi:8-oxo-dGTP pyrophosphatase MutT (NUDIX family)